MRTPYRPDPPAMSYFPERRRFRGMNHDHASCQGSLYRKAHLFLFLAFFQIVHIPQQRTPVIELVAAPNIVPGPKHGVVVFMNMPLLRPFLRKQSERLLRQLSPSLG